MADQLAEFLLQVQGGLSQGSLKGMDAPNGSVTITCNSKETDRYVNCQSLSVVSRQQFIAVIHTSF